MASFAQMKKNNSFDQLNAQLQKMSTNQQQQKSFDDDRYWKPDVDKAG